MVCGSLSTDMYKSPSLNPRSVKETGFAFVYVTPFKVYGPTNSGEPGVPFLIPSTALSLFSISCLVKVFDPTGAPTM